MRADYSDQTAIFDPDAFGWPVHIIGLGGIGGALVFPLLKLGIKELHVWDNDEVEPRNIPAQLVYRLSDIGTSKADAVCEFAKRQEVECIVTPHNEFVTSETQLEGVVISGVDKMTQRSNIWTAVQSNPAFVPLYLDGRIGGEQFQLLSVRPADFNECEMYEKWLFPDEEAADLPCAARTVIHPPTVLAGLMVAQLTLFYRKETIKTNICCHLKTMQFQAT